MEVCLSNTSLRSNVGEADSVLGESMSLRTWNCQEVITAVSRVMLNRLTIASQTAKIMGTVTCRKCTDKSELWL